MLVIAVNLLPCLIYKVSFIMGMYGWEKTVYIGFGATRGFKPPLGVWIRGNCPYPFSYIFSKAQSSLKVPVMSFLKP